jgi:hypothetical protein
MKQVILDSVLAEPESICNLLVAFTLRGVFGHLKFPTGKLVDLAGFDALAGWSASEGFEQEPCMVLARPNLAPTDTLDTTGKVGERLGPAKHTESATSKSADDFLGGLNRIIERVPYQSQQKSGK